ncbi:ABC transporter [Streptococcus anginosus]|uniref:ABC transporter n=1 Tax=Streptococcus anginosus TaxID=1328 RepID=UPI0017804AF0|nr:ABC transporter [Streptococcus anginosus]MCW1010128.1 ABC transporter [Streptococcus anginosus]MDB8648183.1 ABC transporter [Streptococcus anginosus]MED5918930.1 ABC transporter [Streptococcus anginosus]MED5959818.1 ABC transporter [Streptococcus anginosus]MED5972750.1 ABC transporter [Streptococcus anginosus]
MTFDDKRVFEKFQEDNYNAQVSVVRRAMINQPELLFADEPTGALNSKISQKVMESFKEINKKGVTIVLVTHDSKVSAYANRIVFMKYGKILTELEHIKKQNQDIQNDNDITILII